MSVFRRQKSLVGLDLGSSVVKAVELTLEGPEPVKYLMVIDRGQRRNVLRLHITDLKAH